MGHHIRMVSVILILLGCAFLLQGAEAALAPRYQRLSEFDAAVGAAFKANPKFGSQGLLDRIERMPDGNYRAWAANCFLPISITVIGNEGDPPRPGPVRFQASSGSVRCIGGTLTPIGSSQLVNEETAEQLAVARAEIERLTSEVRAKERQLQAFETTLSGIRSLKSTLDAERSRLEALERACNRTKDTADPAKRSK